MAPHLASGSPQITCGVASLRQRIRCQAHGRGACDPHEVQDAGILVLEIFKINCYAQRLKCLSDDPRDRATVRRVLSIALVGEY
jgi:hypothetical protein